MLFAARLCVQVDSIEITFNAEITSSYQQQDTSTDSWSGSYGSYSRWWNYRNNFNCNWSGQSQSKTGYKEENSFSLKVWVKAKQDDIPAGAKRLLNILEEAMIIATERQA